LLPGCQSHVDLGGIGGGIDQFRRRLSGDGPVQLVLNRGEEILGNRRLGIVIRRKGVDIGDLLIKSPLAGPDFPNPLQQFVKIILAEDPFALFEPFIVEHKPLDDELPQRLRGPNAEARGLIAVHPVAHGDDGVEVVVAGLVVFPVSGSCFQNGNNCILHQLAGSEDIFQVLVDRGHFDPEKLRQGLLRQPGRLILKKDLHLNRPIRRGIEQELLVFVHKHLPAIRSTSGTRNSPEMSLGRRVSRRAASATDSLTAKRILSRRPFVITPNAEAIGLGGTIS